MREIGRLREFLVFAGGGTGLPLDLDDHDTADLCYEQLVVYSPEDERIMGGYRFFDCAKLFDQQKNLIEGGTGNLSTSHYFNFSDKFVREYLPYSIELADPGLTLYFSLQSIPEKDFLRWIIYGMVWRNCAYASAHEVFFW